MDVLIPPPHGHSSHYSSAPSSPTRLAELYCGFDELLISAGPTHRVSPASVPFAWEEKPGVPKTPTHNSHEDEFSFHVSCDLGGGGSVPADDLFHGGRIKTSAGRNPPQPQFQEKGRERGFSSSSRLPSSRSRRARSLSPLGVADYRQQQPPVTMRMPPPSSPSSPACSSENGSKKWSFRDLFLFRSASDGSAMDKYPLKKFLTVNRRTDQDFRSSGESGSVSRRRGRVSAHELHYGLTRANSNEMKKKTYLPYKQGILGGLSFNP